MLSDFFRICHLNNIRLFILLLHVLCIRAVARFKILGVPVLFDGNNLPPPPLVEIGLTDLPKTGGLATALGKVGSFSYQSNNI